MNRTDRIHARLAWCEQKGIIRSHYSSSPDGRRRWVVEGVGFTERVFSTPEVEAFLLGATEGRTTGLLDAPVPS